jgi:hypothetical protein
MNVYRRRQAKLDHDNRRWTELDSRASPRSSFGVSCAVRRINTRSAVCAAAFVTWTFWRLRVGLSCLRPAFSHASPDSFLGVVAPGALDCGLVGERPPGLVEGTRTTRALELSGTAGRGAVQGAVAAVGLFTYDVSGGIVTLNGSMSARDSVVLPEDTELGRREHVGSGSRVVTDVGEFNWVDSEPGPVIARVRVGRLTGRLYPDSVERDDGVYDGYLP